MPGTMGDFEDIQGAFHDRLAAHGAGALETGTTVVLPSITFPSEELRKIVGIEYYEERLLCLLLLLRDPGRTIVYPSSMPIAPEIVDYYLSFVDEGSARDRARFLSLGDPQPRALTAKLLDDRGSLDALRALVDDPDRAYFLPFNVTELEGRLVESSGIPVYGPRPDQAPLGSKSGARRVARAAGVRVLPGAEDIFSLGALEDEIARLRSEHPAAGSAVIKLNNGFSGQGNAVVDLIGYRPPVTSAPILFCATEESWATYGPKIEAEGAVVEEHLRGPIASPSVQLRIRPGGAVEIISTHDQVLGGPDDQVYMGCRFPAREDYRDAIAAAGRAIARTLADAGVVGSFGIDFVVAGDGAIFSSEINLRLGGTTHPFVMAHLATQGTYDEASGELRAGGRAKSYVGSDNLKSPAYAGLEPGRVIDSFAARGLLFDRNSGTGVTLHLLGALKDYGKLGAVAIADAADDAAELYAEVERTLGALTSSR